jgi:hypothetical protein
MSEAKVAVEVGEANSNVLGSQQRVVVGSL